MALQAEQIDKLKITLATGGWCEVMRPALENRGRSAMKSLALTRSERAIHFKGTDFDTDDDVLRAIIRDVEWMTAVWTNEIQVADYNRRLDELERQNSDQNPA